MKIKNKTTKFIEKAIIVHGNRYDYSLVDYYKAKTKVLIICPDHGEFWQEPNHHLSGHKCKKCSREEIDKITKIKFRENFKARAIKVHGLRYCYDLVEYEAAKKKVTIKCLEHGMFSQTPDKHIGGKQGCPKCIGRVLDIKDFIYKANKTHNNRYYYNISEYTDCKKYIDILCSEHGIFRQTPDNHVSGKGCPKCSSSKSQYLIEKFIIEKYSHLSEIIINDRIIPYHTGRNLEIDINLIDLNIGIEYNGSYHYDETSYFNTVSKTGFEGVVERDAFKENWCRENSINLIKISYEEFDIAFKENDKREFFDSLKNRIDSMINL